MTPRAAGLVLIAAALLAGCGGDEGGGSGDTTVKNVELGAPIEVKGTASKPPYGELKVSIAVEAEAGTAEDLKDFNLDPDERSGTPYYVTTKVTNLDKPVTGGVGVASVDAFDDTDAAVKEITLLGDFPKCELRSAPESLPTGASYSTCKVYIAPKGRKLARLERTETVFDGPNLKHVWQVG